MTSVEGTVPVTCSPCLLPLLLTAAEDPGYTVVGEEYGRSHFWLLGLAYTTQEGGQGGRGGGGSGGSGGEQEVWRTLGNRSVRHSSCGAL